MNQRLPTFSWLSAIVVTAAVLIADNSHASPQWDGDGGFSGDYSNIARLRWTGPGSPDTYAQYLARRGSTPFRSSLISSSNAKSRGSRIQKVLVIVNSALYAGIQTRLNTYVNDLTADGYAVDVYQNSGGTCVDMKNFILGNVSDLVGCVFVGDQPSAWFEHDYWGPEEFPCDLFYMDLDGTWTDTDTDGMYDAHAAGSGDEGPEIFVGHIDASMMSGNEVDITNDYFDKNHLYRLGGIPHSGYALTYTEDDWASIPSQRTDIKYAYGDTGFDDVSIQ
ncbi:MAG: hypothetical protein V2A76_09355 [Planctomycetota bacterium]